MSRHPSSLPPFWTRTTIAFALMFVTVAVAGVVTVLLPELGDADSPASQEPALDTGST